MIVRFCSLIRKNYDDGRGKSVSLRILKETAGIKAAPHHSAGADGLTARCGSAVHAAAADTEEQVLAAVAAAALGALIAVEQRQCLRLRTGVGGQYDFCSFIHKKRI